MNNDPMLPGDIVFAACDIYNDGSFPDREMNELLVASGTRGIVLNQGHLEDNENQEVFLVQFQIGSGLDELTPPIGCWPDDLKPLIEVEQ